MCYKWVVQFEVIDRFTQQFQFICFVCTVIICLFTTIHYVNSQRDVFKIIRELFVYLGKGPVRSFDDWMNVSDQQNVNSVHLLNVAAVTQILLSLSLSLD